MGDFFPQNYKNARFDTRWIESMLQYLLYLKAMYVVKHQQHGIKPCEWAQKWNHFRTQVINGAQKLTKSRFEVLEGTDESGSGGAEELSYKDGIKGGMLSWFYSIFHIYSLT